MDFDNVQPPKPFQAEYEGSIPFTRSNVFNGLATERFLLPTNRAEHFRQNLLSLFAMLPTAEPVLNLAEVKPSCRASMRFSCTLRFRNTPRDRYPLLLFYHPLNIYRKRVIKQTDVVLAMFLLGDAFSPSMKKRNFDFYDPLTTGDSSLSSCVEAIIAAQTGDMDKAIRYGMAALLMDLADAGGNVKDGCHIASMGGTWMMLTYGFGGMRDSDGMLSFWPRRAPEEISAIVFIPVAPAG